VIKDWTKYASDWDGGRKKEKKCGRQSTGAERSSSIDIDNNCFIEHFYQAVLPKRIIIGLCWTILILYSLLEFFGTRNNCFGIAV
jgi:hypothetical protein